MARCRCKVPRPIGKKRLCRDCGGETKAGGGKLEHLWESSPPPAISIPSSPLTRAALPVPVEIVPPSPPKGPDPVPPPARPFSAPEPSGDSGPLEPPMNALPALDPPAFRRCKVPGCPSKKRHHNRCDKHISRAKRWGFIDEDPAGDEERYAEVQARRAQGLPLPGEAPKAPKKSPAAATETVATSPAPARVTTGNPGLPLATVIDLLTRCGATFRPVVTGGDQVILQVEGESIPPQRLLAVLLEGSAR